MAEQANTYVVREGKTFNTIIGGNAVLLEAGDTLELTASQIAAFSDVFELESEGEDDAPKADTSLTTAAAPKAPEAPKAPAK